MSKEGYEAYSVEIPTEKIQDPDFWKEFQKIMDEEARLMNEHIDSVARELGISVGCANDVVYLRGRSRWTQEMEDKLILWDKTNTRPENFNIMDGPF